MKKALILTTLLTLSAPLISFACNDDDCSVPKMLKCKTFSTDHYNGSKKSRDVTLAKKMVIEECSKTPYADPRECEANVKCEGESHNPLIRCETESVGRPHKLIGRSQALTSLIVIEICSKTPFAIPEECEANLYCVPNRCPDKSSCNID